MRDERRFKSRENQIFEQIEDLLDEEHIRGKVALLEKNTAAATEMAIQKAMGMVNDGLHTAVNYFNNPALNGPPQDGAINERD